MEAISARLEADDKDRVRAYTARVKSADVLLLDRLLAGGEEELQENILTVTGERLERIRVLAVPPPRYEAGALGEYLRGDVARITGSAKSCNIRLTHDGVIRFRERMARAAARMREWLEISARIPHYGETAASVIISFRPDVDVLAEVEDRRLAETGAAIAAQSWTAEDFRDWEQGGA